MPTRRAAGSPAGGPAGGPEMPRGRPPAALAAAFPSDPFGDPHARHRFRNGRRRAPACAAPRARRRTRSDRTRPFSPRPGALLGALEAGRPLDAPTLREAMTRAFGGSDAGGAWAWKDAYEAAEATVILFVQRYGRAMRRRAGAGPDGPANMLAMLSALAALEPSHTRRSEAQVRLQQFSTPLPLAYAALKAAAAPSPGDTSCWNRPLGRGCWP